MSVELIENEDGRWFWHIKSEGNNKVLAHSEIYESRQAAEDGIFAAREAMEHETKVFSVTEAMDNALGR